MRGVAKTVNFGLLYGMQAFGLSRDTGMSRSDAQAFIDQYWSRLPRVKSFFDQTIKDGAAKGYVSTLYGRRRAVPDLQSGNTMRKNAAERVAVNMPVQGTAADIMKIAMINLHQALDSHRDSSRILLQVHDELVLEVASTSRDEISRIVKATMEGAAQLDVPLVVDVSVGPNWQDLADIEVIL
jgi:DNA polymerase-1